MSQDKHDNMEWFRVGDIDMLEVDRITTVQIGHTTICLTRTKEGYGAISNRCPHQGGPLGDGFLQDGFVVCPWHGWEYNPCTGLPPSGYADESAPAYAVEERADGLYVGVEEFVHKRTLMDQMVDVMTDWGVDTVFGMVGHSNLGLADAFYNAAKAGRLRYFGIRHEGAAAFAACGYAKLTGRPAACFSIAGPGATNLLTGLWDAKVDRVPILALTGQVNTQVLGPGAFQELPLDKAFEAVAAWSQTVLRSENATELMALALKHAVIKRDVGHLIFPDEVQTMPAVENSKPRLQEGRIANPQITPPVAELERAIALIEEAERPGIIIGNGARPYAVEVLALAEKLDAPVITTFKAKGTVDDRHPLACGVLGRSGTPVASATMMRSDLLLVFGASFSNHTSITTKRPVIQVDFDRMMLGKFHEVTLPLWGEIGATLKLIMEGVSPQSRPARRAYVARLWGKWRADKEKRAATPSRSGRIPNAAIFQVMSKVTPADAVIAVDVGNNAYSFGMYFESQQQHVLMSGYLGSIGFAFPAAMGAWAAEPGRKIIAVAGDGGFGQYMGEFTTAVKYNMNITLVLLNNSELAKISREQRGGNFHVWQTDLHNPNFAQYAKNCGGLGLRVEKIEDLRIALDEAFAYEGPSLVEIISAADQL
jgi:thiamine pyrophosphate-dependent acetolactate synthase large subunit-like protein/nitrite reductase/ring-hydroxylating ferredoxin subunit